MGETSQPLRPDAAFRIAPSLGELGLIGRKVAATAIPRGRRRDQTRWAEAGVAPTQRHVLQAFSGLTDEVFLNVVRAMTSRAAGREIDRVLDETYAALDLYRARGWLDPQVLHRTPGPLDATTTAVRVGGHHWHRLDGREPWTPPEGSPGAERWLSYPGGQRAVVHLRRHREPRPWLVMVHGAYMGDPKMDARIFDVEHLFHGLGLNVALPVLPLHGERRSRQGLARSLPSLDTMDHLHGITQAVHEVRSLLARIRAEDPEQKVGIYGVSLGGNVTALTAGLEGPLDVVIAGMPAVDFQSVFLGQTPREIRTTAWFEAFHAATVELNAPLSPLAVTPATPVDRRYVYAARGDRVLPPAKQALRLLEHWDHPTTYWFDGAHVPQVRNKGVRRFVADAVTKHLP